MYSRLVHRGKYWMRLSAEPVTRLFLVSIIYLLIVAALYFGAWPYKMRDFLDWLFDKSARPARFGWAMLGCAVVLLGLSFSY